MKMNAIEIKGKVNTAFCYAKVVEDEAYGTHRQPLQHRP